MVTYSLDNNAGGRFTIDANTGVVTVNGAIDREAAASITLPSERPRTDTSFSTQTFHINIGDEDEFNVGAVTDNNAAANSVVENASNRHRGWHHRSGKLTPMRRLTRLLTVYRTTTEVASR